MERLCTAYQSRTDDLLRERQMSWTTRRMRLVVLSLCATLSLSKAGAKVRTFSGLAKYFFKKSYNTLVTSSNIFQHNKRKPPENGSNTPPKKPNSGVATPLKTHLKDTPIIVNNPPAARPSGASQAGSGAGYKPGAYSAASAMAMEPR